MKCWLTEYFYKINRWKYELYIYAWFYAGKNLVYFEFYIDSPGKLQKTADVYFIVEKDY